MKQIDGKVDPRKVEVSAREEWMQRAELPLRALTISDQIRFELRDAIISGVFQPGEQLTEAKLAKHFGVSRTPLRKVFQLLEAENLLERTSSGSVRVPEISAKEVEELYEIRSALEGLVARKVAERVKTKTLPKDELESLQEMALSLKIIEGEENQAKQVLEMDFHARIAEMSSNQRCISMLEVILNNMRRYMHLAPPRRSKQSIWEHIRILNSILEGDPVSAETLMVNHILNSAEIYVNKVKDFEKQHSATLK